MTNDELYKVITQGTQKMITMPKDSTGYYLRKVCHDGAITFLPVKMPIVCQAGTPGGGSMTDEEYPTKFRKVKE